MKPSISRRHFIVGVIAATALASAPAFARRGQSSTQAAVPLSEGERDLLVYMREEEKLARDVYLTLNGIWPHATFVNIAASEQRHMDAVKKMLVKYQLPDPVQDAVGAFTDQGLQTLYNTLIASGTGSLIDALKVGCTIEDVDIMDLQRAMDLATHVDLDVLYQHLLDGSRNHLRAFAGALDALGASYIPQYMSQETYDAIIGL